MQKLCTFAGVFRCPEECRAAPVHRAEPHTLRARVAVQISRIRAVLPRRAEACRAATAAKVAHVVVGLCTAGLHLRLDHQRGVRHERLFRAVRGNKQGLH